MKIALIGPWYSEKMGYSDNFMTKHLAALGHDVHLVSGNAQSYFNSPLYKETLEPFLGPGITECGVKRTDEGYTIHRLPIVSARGRLHVRGLAKKLMELKPDVVQTGSFRILMHYEAALLKPFLGYKLFSECHTHASVFPPALGKGGKKAKVYWSVYPHTIGKFVGAMDDRCYAISDDAADIATRFYGVPKEKVVVRTLGSDTEIFHPASSAEDVAERAALRKKLGFADDEVVCIYTGRLNEEKDPLWLAKAVGSLAVKGRRVRGLFIGHGPKRYLDLISENRGCVVQYYVPARDLAPFYRAADIAVWPKQESTSQLDAIASGLPIILSDRVQVRERHEGNGLLYREGDTEHLAQQIESILSPELRKKMAAIGVERARRDFSWRTIAQQYVKDYEELLAKG